MRAIPIDPGAIRCVYVDAAPVRDYDANGELLPDSQKQDAAGLPLWNLTVLIRVEGEQGAETSRVRVASAQPPSFEEFARIAFTGLKAMPWSRGEKSGVSFFADGVQNGNGSGHRAQAKAEG